MTPVRTLVVEDEPLVRRRLVELVDADPRLLRVGEAADGLEALDRIAAMRPDLVFLDVHMPELDGFEVLDALDDPALVPAVVFVTAYDGHALRAFDVGAVDYLLKPVTPERFERAVGRAVEAAGRADRIRTLRDLAAERVAAAGPLHRFVVHRGGRHAFVAAADVDRIEADGNYLRLYEGPRTHLVRRTMKEAEARLDPHRFVRVHRSHIVAVDRVAALESGSWGEAVVVLTDGTRLPVSRSYAARVRRLRRG